MRQLAVEFSKQSEHRFFDRLKTPFGALSRPNHEVQPGRKFASLQSKCFSHPSLPSIANRRVSNAFGDRESNSRIAPFRSNRMNDQHVVRCDQSRCIDAVEVGLQLQPKLFEKAKMGFSRFGHHEDSYSMDVRQRADGLRTLDDIVQIQVRPRAE